MLTEPTSRSEDLELPLISEPTEACSTCGRTQDRLKGPSDGLQQWTDYGFSVVWRVLAIVAAVVALLAGQPVLAQLLGLV